MNPLDILVRRVACLPNYTIGHMYVDGKFICDTLEDTDRGLTQNMSLASIIKLKKAGITAIPRGRYRVDMRTVSPKYSTRPKWVKYCGAIMPRILNVPGYSGVLIHTGNSPSQTEGCLLVGENKVKGGLIRSTEAFEKLYPILREADRNGREIWITIE